jgi:uncharacterized protein YcgI (DUF1989 family)
MPLLMIEPAIGPLPPEADVLVPGGAARGVRVAAGQLLAIRDQEGGQPAALFAVTEASPALFLSPHHTRVFSNSFMLRLGMRLVTNKRRPVMVLGVSADHLRHDLLMPITEASVNGETGGADRVRDKVFDAFGSIGAAPERIADPVNLFLDVGVGADGGLSPRGASSRAGDAVVFRAVADLAVVVVAPHADPCLWSRPSPGALAIRVRNELEDLEDFIHPQEGELT